MNTVTEHLPGAVWNRARDWHRAARWRRSLVAGAVVAQTLVAVYYLLATLPYHGSTGIEKTIAVLFAILFAWISAGFWVAIVGFVVRRFGGDPYSPLRRHDPVELANTPLARTAIVMPIYHEPVAASLGALRATYRCLQRMGKLEAFDFFILSDSRDPNVWLEEQAAWFELCKELDGFGRIHFRRRPVNLDYKSGNVADFLRRWGRSYEYMIVFDSDSAMGANSIVPLVQLMEREPQVGMIQTKPTIVNGRSAFARFQQLGNTVYGALFGTGLAALQMGEAAYWGHNAIIRVRPFMQACGLKKLPGFGLFRGPILSHDFVEAAYMGRAGYEVWLEPDLPNSYENSPPSLVDELSRDRRWAKGNLQHLWLLLFGRKIRFAHRMVFLNGLLSYLASPLWLAFLIASAVETTRFVLWPINYFPNGRSLFPLWPEWHPDLAITLAGSTAVLLFLPKFLAWVDVLLKRETRSYGGGGRLGISIALETLVSTLLAPIRMLAHTGFVLSALFNISLHWGGQNREAETRWRDALIRHAPGSITALAWAGFAYWLDPLYFWWSMPVVVPLVLAAPTSVILSRVRLGAWLRKKGLLLIPEEIEQPPVLKYASEADPTDRARLPAFHNAVLNKQANELHSALARRRNGQPRKQRLAALRERCLQDGPEALSRKELDQLAQDAESLQWLHREAWRSAPGSYWDRVLSAATAHHASAH